MKIAIIGAGAMGSLYGGYLSKAGNEVYLLDVWQEHVDAINQQGLVIQEGEEQVQTHPRAVTSQQEVGTAEVVIVFVKSIHTGNAIKENLDLVGENTLLLTLQNGYGNAEAIAEFVDPDKIMVGTTAQGATLLGPGMIRHAGKGATHIGKYKGRKDTWVENFAEVLRSAGFETEVSDHAMEMIWAKLFINVGINALTGLLIIVNGQLLHSEETQALMKLAVDEAVTVANAAGMTFDPEKVLSDVKKIAEATSENRSSMLQDLTHQRKTEIDMINGAIVKQGRLYSVETPVNETLTRLIKSKEHFQ